MSIVTIRERPVNEVKNELIKALNAELVEERRIFLDNINQAVNVLADTELADELRAEWSSYLVDYYQRKVAIQNG